MKRLISLFLFLALVIPAGNAKGDEFYKIIYNMGYTDVSVKELEKEEIVLPERFGAVYERYNEIQKAGGYDLTAYRGKSCTRYTYEIPSKNARANILVYEGKIIGGDISSITIDGIMIPIKKEYED
ncbi:MAG: DUF4830 domain-containing protein [Clostridia bacterium]|nr:DUF4830 domain-containing protein [Clostridia bacterium]